MKLKLPKNIAEKMVRNREDFKVQTFRCGGNGGQNVNKVESGARVIDKITGISCECREERDQLTNKKKAFERLAQKVANFYQEEERKANQKELIPEQWIRTYKDGLVEDRRIPNTTFPQKDILDGKLELIYSKINE